MSECFLPLDSAVLNVHDEYTFHWHIYKFICEFLYELKHGTENLVIQCVNDPDGKPYHYITAPFPAFLLTWKESYDHNQKHIMVGKHSQQTTLLSKGHDGWTRWMGTQLHWSQKALVSAQKKGYFIGVDPRDAFFPLVSHKRDSQVYIAYNIPLDGDEGMIAYIDKLEGKKIDVASLKKQMKHFGLYDSVSNGGPAAAGGGGPPVTTNADDDDSDDDDAGNNKDNDEQVNHAGTDEGSEADDAGAGNNEDNDEQVIQDWCSYSDISETPSLTLEQVKKVVADQVKIQLQEMENGFEDLRTHAKELNDLLTKAVKINQDNSARMEQIESNNTMIQKMFTAFLAQPKVAALADMPDATDKVGNCPNAMWHGAD
jgi:hypothetical protein